MNIKKLCFLFLILSLFSFSYAKGKKAKGEESLNKQETQEKQDSQEVNESSEEEVAENDEKIIFEKLFDGPVNFTLEGRIYAAPGDFTDFIHSTDFVLELSPGFYLNPFNKELNSGPTAPIYPVTIGFIWPDYTFISIQPTVSFFSSYNLWYNGTTYPAEIENRTATTLNFMLNLPAVFSIYIGKNRLQALAGVSVFIRHGFLASGVSESDSGYTGNAADDVTEINKWFWENAHFLYLSAGFTWIRELTGSLKGGPTINAYLPIGSFINQEGFLGTVISFGIKITL